MTTIVTLAYGPIREVWQLAAKTWNPYCQRHGYFLKTYTDLMDKDRHPSWNKVPIILNELENATGPVWWVDADMTVANLDVALPERKEKPIWFSSDWNGLCAGCFMAYPNQWVNELLQTVRFLGDVSNDDQFGKGLGCKWEQNAFKVLQREFKDASSKMGLLPQEFVNDQPVKATGKEQIYHFGGRPNNVRCALIKQIHKV